MVTRKQSSIIHSKPLSFCWSGPRTQPGSFRLCDFAVPEGSDASLADSRPRTKKSVQFGGPLSPEFFDKHLPPSMPLQKGGTPARVPTPGGALRSALKTPQRRDAATPATYPGPDLLSDFGASPVLKMPRNRRMASVGEDEDTQVRRRVAAASVASSPILRLTFGGNGTRPHRLPFSVFRLLDFPADYRGDRGRDVGRRRSVFDRQRRQVATCLDSDQTLTTPPAGSCVFRVLAQQPTGESE